MARDRRPSRRSDYRYPAPAEPWGRHARRPGVAGPAMAGTARLAFRSAAAYARWVARAPETRGLGTALAALYPAGEIGYLAHADPLMMAGFAPPAAAVAWTSTWKAHRSRRYSATAAALAARALGSISGRASALVSTFGGATAG